METDETTAEARDGSEPIGLSDVLVRAIAERARATANIRLMFPGRTDRARIRLDGGKARGFFRPPKWMVDTDSDS